MVKNDGKWDGELKHLSVFVWAMSKAQLTGKSAVLCNDECWDILLCWLPFILNFAHSQREHRVFQALRDGNLHWASHFLMSFGAGHF